MDTLLSLFQSVLPSRARPKPWCVREAEAAFTPAELEALRREHCLRSLDKFSQALPAARFLEWAGLSGAPAALTEGLCAAVRRHSGPDDAAAGITLDGIIVSKALAERMDRSAAEDWTFDILDSQQTGRVSRAHLQAVVQACLQLALGDSSSGGGGDAASSNDHVAAAIAAGACSYSSAGGSAGGGAGADVLTRDGYAKLCRVSPALHGSLVTLLNNIGRSAEDHTTPAPPPAAPPPPAAAAAATTGAAAATDAPAGDSKAHNSRSRRAVGAAAQQFTAQAGPGPSSAALAAAAAAAASAARGLPGRVLLPELMWGSVSPAEGLLQPGWAWLLAAGMPPVQRLEWRLLYNSQRHGISCSTFLAKLGREAAPTLLLILDKGGALFGGVAQQPWAKAGGFYGDAASVVFSLLPAARVHPACGSNGNIQWCGVGFSQLPNGLGFGGQVGYFACFLDATFDKGMSRPTATFANPSLSSSETFQVDAVEAWLLVPPGDDDGRASGGQGSAAGGSVLDRAREDQRILQLAGVGSNYSAALRADEPIEE